MSYRPSLQTPDEHPAWRSARHTHRGSSSQGVPKSEVSLVANKWCPLWGALLIFLFQAVLLNGATSQGGVVQGEVVAQALRFPQDVVVYLENVAGDFRPPAKNPIMDQRNLVYRPHVLPILVGTTVDFPNSDEVRHNVFSPSRTKPFNLGTYPKGVVRKVQFEKPGVISLLCNVHQEMSAYIVVLSNPHFAKTGRDGKFIFRNIPPGTYTIHSWHEKLKPAKQTVEVSEGKSVTVNFTLRR